MLLLEVTAKGMGGTFELATDEKAVEGMIIAKCALMLGSVGVPEHFVANTKSILAAHKQRFKNLLHCYVPVIANWLLTRRAFRAINLLPTSCASCVPTRTLARSPNNHSCRSRTSGDSKLSTGLENVNCRASKTANTEVVVAYYTDLLRKWLANT